MLKQMKNPLHGPTGVTPSSPRWWCPRSRPASPASRARSLVLTARRYMLATRPSSPLPLGIPTAAEAHPSLPFSHVAPFSPRVLSEPASDRRGASSAAAVEAVEGEADRGMVWSELFPFGWLE